jgi:hypothetical protein
VWLELELPIEVVELGRMTEIENFQKLKHLNQFSRQKHTHALV